MRAYEYKEGMTEEQMKNGAYWERNMLALLYADGWYYDRDNDWPGWRRVLSLRCGQMCFHIPDDFDIGVLPEIESNWNGHSTRQKWNLVAELTGSRLEWD